MAVYEKPNSPFWYMLLEGYGRRRESTGIPRDATTSEQRKKNRAQADEVYHARMVQLARGKVGLPVDSSITFQAFSAWYETHRLPRQRSAARARVILTRLRAHFGAMPLREIRPARWAEYETDRLTEGVVLSTVGRELALMKTILTAAVGEHLEVSPLAHVKRRGTTLPPKLTLTKADETKLLAELHDAELRDIYLVAVGTLLRQQNVILLQRKHYRGTTLVVETKTTPHEVPLGGPTTLQKRAGHALKRRMPSTHAGDFFPKWAARFRHDRDGANAKFLQAFRRACKRAGIPWGLLNQGVVWHTATRASGATRMLREHGVDVRTIQVIGHWRSLDQMAEYLGIAADLLTSPTKVRRAG